MTWTHLGHSSVRLAPGVFDDRRRLNREYLASLREAALLQNHFIEAGIGEQGWHLHPSGETPADRGLDRHWGWETPGSLLRGHFVGHWMKWPRSSDPGVSQPQCLSSPRSAGVSPEGCRCQPCSPMPASMKWFWRRAASRSEARYSRLSRRRSSNTPGANRTLECPRCVHVMPGPSSQRSISL